MTVTIHKSWTITSAWRWLRLGAAVTPQGPRGRRHPPFLSPSRAARRYDTAFKSGFFPALYANAGKGSVITEGGSRWYQPPLGGDFGSPLTVLNFLEALKLMKAAGAVDYIPGAFTNWITFVGNDNTRWHWNSADGSPEPAVPWDGWLFPDGTPVSHTEAGAARR